MDIRVIGVETGLYYLNSRYYDPEIGRFISPDGISYLDPETLGGLNLYAYCGNNPVMYVDSNGCSALLAIALSLIAVFSLGGAIYKGVESANAGDNGLEIFKNIMLGFGAGLVAAGGALLLISIIISPIPKMAVFGIGQAIAFEMLSFDVGLFIISSFQGNRNEDLIEYPQAPTLPTYYPTVCGS